jgi:hypothetical protein
MPFLMPATQLASLFLHLRRARHRRPVKKSGHLLTGHGGDPGGQRSRIHTFLDRAGQQFSTQVPAAPTHLRSRRGRSLKCAPLPRMGPASPLLRVSRMSKIRADRTVRSNGSVYQVSVHLSIPPSGAGVENRASHNFSKGRPLSIKVQDFVGSGGHLPKCLGKKRPAIMGTWCTPCSHLAVQHCLGTQERPQFQAQRPQFAQTGSMRRTSIAG